MPFPFMLQCYSRYIFHNMFDTKDYCLRRRTTTTLECIALVLALCSNHYFFLNVCLAQALW